ncbi:MAG: YkvA family protein [Kaistella sp.]
MLRNLKEQVRKLKQETVPIYHALFDPRTPLSAKIVAGLTVAYLLSPIDLIPDFIPVLGLLDDLILVPLLIKATLSLIPEYVIEDIKAKMDSREKLSSKWYYALPIVLLYGYLLFVLFRQTRHWLDF